MRHSARSEREHARGGTSGRERLGERRLPVWPSRCKQLAGYQWRIGEAVWNSQIVSRFRLAVVGFLIEEGNTKLRGVDAPLRQVTGMSRLVVVDRRREFTRKIPSENSMDLATVERGPLISDVRDMDVEKRNSGDPEDQPTQNQETPLQARWSWRHQPLSVSYMSAKA